MNHTFSAPVTAAQRQRDTLLGALVGLARSTVNEPKTEDTGRGTVRPVTFPETKKHFLPENEPFFTKPLYKCAAKNYYIVICCCLMQSFSTGAFRYYSHTQNYMRKKVESMSVKKPVVPAAAEAPAAEAKPARKTAKSAVKTEKAPKTEKTAHKGRPPLSPEIYVEFAGKQYNITDLVDRAKADYRLTHKVGVQSCKIYVKPEEEAAYYVVNKVGGKLPL